MNYEGPQNMDVLNDYKSLFQFIDTYLPTGFEGINKEDPLMRKVNELMKKNNQFFYIADMIQLEILYTCTTISDLIGVEPSEFTPGYEFASTHPDDMERHGNARSQMIKLCNELFASGEDYRIMSTNLRHKVHQGHYVNFLIQGYAFSSKMPKPSVYCLFIKTDIDWFGQIKHGYNYYIGKDMSNFRVPDKKLILTGCVFTDREYEILDLLRQGLDSKTIGEKIFISQHTVDTHRRNILKKTDKASTSELIMSLQEIGFF